MERPATGFVIRHRMLACHGSRTAETTAKDSEVGEIIVYGDESRERAELTHRESLNYIFQCSAVKP